MQAAITQWLEKVGIPHDPAITPMTPGLGKTVLWKIRRTDEPSDLVLRVFPPDDSAVAERETRAMRAAQEAGVPVPAVITTGIIDGRPAILTPFVPGETVAAVMKRKPGDAATIGRQLGIALANLHHLAAPSGLAAPERWIARGGPALEPVHDQLRALPRADRLLHLDYHPENVMMLNGEVSAIIDWTNTLPGPPHIDLGRSRATLQMIQDMRGDVAATVAKFEAGLVDGHASVHGPDPHPELSLAWGVGSICVDFEPQVDNPGSWVSAELVTQLQAKRDALIATWV